MLIYSKDRYVPTDVNMIVLRGLNDEGFYYVHRTLYDQAVVLYDMYIDQIEVLIKAITNKTESRDDVDFFLQNVPAPINILGPFLLLVTKPLDDLVDMVGAIHVMSGPLSFRKMLQIPYDMRNMNPSFSLSIREEYKLSWDRFFITTIPYTDDLLAPKPVVEAAHPTAPRSNLDPDTADLVQSANLSAYMSADEAATPDIDLTDPKAIARAVEASAGEEFDGDNLDVSALSEAVLNMSDTAIEAMAEIDWDAFYATKEAADAEREGKEAEAEEAKPEPIPEPVIVEKPVEQPAPKLSGVDALLNI